MKHLFVLLFCFFSLLASAQESYEIMIEQAKKSLELGKSAPSADEAISHYLNAIENAKNASEKIVFLLKRGSKGLMKDKLETKQTNAVEIIANSSYAVGLLYDENGNKKEALKFLSQAKVIGQNIELQDLVSDIDGKLEEINNPASLFKKKAEEFGEKAKGESDVDLKKKLEDLAKRYDIISQEYKKHKSISSSAIETEIETAHKKELAYKERIYQKELENNILRIILLFLIIIALFLTFYFYKIAQKKRIIEKREQQLKLILEEKENLLLEKERLEKENAEIEHKVIATMTHNLNTKFSHLVGVFKVLKGRIDRAYNQSADIQESITEFRAKLFDATETFNTIYDVLTQNHISPKRVFVSQFFQEEIKPLCANKDFNIEIIDFQIADQLLIDIDTEAIKQVFQQLVSNAEKHGFEEAGKSYKIVIELVKFQGDYLKIIYKNNGKAFPKGFSFEEYKRLAGKAQSKGSGIGGYWINKVIDLHKGKFTNRPTESSDFPVQFEILLPLEQKIPY